MRHSCPVCDATRALPSVTGSLAEARQSVQCANVAQPYNRSTWSPECRLLRDTSLLLPLTELGPQVFLIAMQSLAAVDSVSVHMQRPFSKQKNTLNSADVDMMLPLCAGWMSACLPCVQYGLTTEKLGPQVWLQFQQSLILIEM